MIIRRRNEIASSKVLSCLLASISCINVMSASTRGLTSETNAVAAAIFDFNLRADNNIKIKHKCPNLDYILGPIHNADADENGVLNKEEYVVFADTVSGGYLSENDRADGFLDMPLALQETYLVLSCLCELYQSEPPPWGGKGCCTNNYQNGSDDHIGIRTNGTAPDEELTKIQQDYFTYVCGTMTEALDGLGLELASPPPTGGPTKKPATATPTTKKPSRKPTRVPTKEPTPQPTSVDTEEPTDKPTDEPTVTLTLVPTEKPVTKQTARPSLRPVTAKPTIKAAVEETFSPTETSDTKSPTPAPITTFPTLQPSASSTIEETKISPPATSSPEGSSISTSAPTTFETESPSSETPPTPVITKSPSLTSVPTIELESKAPTAGDTESPTIVDSSTGGGTKAPSSVESPTEETKSPSADPAQDTKSPSSEAVGATKSPIVDGETIAPSSDTTNAPRSNAPTFSPAPSTSTSSPSKAPSDTGSFTGDVSIPISFTLPGEQYTDGQLEEILSGEDNKFTDELKESLLELIQEVVDEEFGNSTAKNSSDTSSGKERSISKASFPANVTFDSVGKVDCPTESDPTATCLDYNTTIALSVFNGTGLDEAAFIEKFQNAIKAKLESGWLTENFNIEEALSSTPAPAPGPSTDASTDGSDTDRTVGGSNLDVGAIIGICVGGTLALYAIAAIVYHAKKSRQKEDEEFDLEQQAVSDAAAKDMMGPASPDSKNDVSDSWSLDDVSEAQTEGNTSQDHLLPASQMRSSQDLALGNLDEEEDWSESDVNDSTFDSSTVGSGPAQNLTAGSSLAAVGMASTFVAANAAGSSGALDDESGAAGDIDGTGKSDSRGLVGAESSDNGGMSAGTAAALGAAGIVTAGALAAGAYAATKDKSSSSEEAEPQARAVDTSASNLDELDRAIEAGNWGAVGAIAAILASSGYPAKKEPRSATSIKSEDSSGRSGSRDSSNGPTLDQARATEIDKLVEAGDWQGVVLAAARFEADQTMDGESYSASASKSSYRSGSAQSSATPRSMATSGQSSTKTGGGRSQAEIKAEIEALVRRVVPEEADNVDEMLTQFKGREEELVETLRRMQERAIASRARLAVQKSAKLEARARATVPAPVQTSSASVGSRASTKSELEAAIEAGNWEAVGQAAQKMSDGSIASLSMEDRARLREKVSASPGLALSPSSSNEEYNLDALIERGDWPGVIAAAKKASEGTRESSSNMTQEEQDALAQANMWQEIANQSKQEGRQGPAGADDAAAWAISRSLSALNAPQDHDGPVRTIEDMADEESSEASQYESSSYSASKSQSLSADYYRHGI